MPSGGMDTRLMARKAALLAVRAESSWRPPGSSPRVHGEMWTARRFTDFEVSCLLHAKTLVFYFYVCAGTYQRLSA